MLRYFVCLCSVIWWFLTSFVFDFNEGLIIHDRFHEKVVSFVIILIYKIYASFHLFTLDLPFGLSGWFNFSSSSQPTSSQQKRFKGNRLDVVRLCVACIRLLSCCRLTGLEWNAIYFQLPFAWGIVLDFFYLHHSINPNCTLWIQDTPYLYPPQNYYCI